MTERVEGQQRPMTGFGVMGGDMQPQAYIWKLSHDEPERAYVAASDTRRDGLAAGF